VLPFLLRGVNLLGIESATCPRPRRLVAWNRLAATVPLDQLDSLVTEVRLADLPEQGAKILKGETRGRVVVRIDG
jgi:acrylyl-CoA reductase (NADPH)